MCEWQHLSESHHCHSLLISAKMCTSTGKGGLNVKTASKQGRHLNSSVKCDTLDKLG